jgi:hypothetical protein
MIKTDGHTRMKRIDASGTFLVGYLDCTYDQLVKTLGKPELFEGDKTRCEWVVMIDGVVATVYDYKDSTPVRQVTDWHVGGKGRAALDVVAQKTGAYVTRA